MINDAYPEQLPFGSDSFADNPEPRCPCLLLLDTSESMAGPPIAALNSALASLKNDLATDSLAMKRVEIAVISFGPVSVDHQFHTASSFNPPTLAAHGDTPMGSAIRTGLEMVRRRKNEFRVNGVPFYRPWVFLITDGAPTDEWQSAAALVREGEASKSFAFFAVGVAGANMAVLKELSVREPIALEGLKFRDLFLWLSNSMKTVSHSAPGTSLPIETPQGWAEV